MNKLIKAFKTIFLPRKKKKINDTNIIVFGEWYGKRCCDNCLFFANYLSINDKTYNLYWISNKECDDSRLDPSIKRLEKDTLEANHILQKAKYIFVNQGIVDITSNPDFYPNNSILINFWHGVAWKKIGADSLGGSIKAFYCRQSYKKDGTDYYLSTSKEFSHILRKAFNVGDHQIIPSGYPRNSLFYDENSIKQLKQAFLLKHGIEKSAKLIAYLPTFRDKKEQSFRIDTILTNDDFVEFLRENNVFILQKDHFVAGNRENASMGTAKNRMVVDLEISASEILAISDVLITDYSSCFFDYLILNRPIIHYVYDYDYYKDKDRGLYYEIKDVACGQVCFCVDDLINAIKDYVMNPRIDEGIRLSRRKTFMEYDDAEANNKIYRFLLNSNKQH